MSCSADKIVHNHSYSARKLVGWPRSAPWLTVEVSTYYCKLLFCLGPRLCCEAPWVIGLATSTEGEGTKLLDLAMHCSLGFLLTFRLNECFINAPFARSIPALMHPKPELFHLTPHGTCTRSINRLHHPKSAPRELPVCRHHSRTCRCIVNPMVNWQYS